MQVFESVINTYQTIFVVFGISFRLNILYSMQRECLVNLVKYMHRPSPI